MPLVSTGSGSGYAQRLERSKLKCRMTRKGSLVVLHLLRSVAVLSYRERMAVGFDRQYRYYVRAPEGLQIELIRLVSHGYCG